MKAVTLAGAMTLLLASSAISFAREAPHPDLRKDSRAPVTETMDMRDDLFTCNTGGAAGWLAAVAGLGLVTLRGRRPR